MPTVVSVTLPRLQAVAETGFTVAQLRAFGITTALGDPQLQILIDDAFSAIDTEIGPPGEVDELLTARGDLLRLNRRAASIRSVVERAPLSPITLAADDYELSRSGRILTRLRTGTNPSWWWRGRVRAAYVPVDDTASRIRAAVALIKLEIIHTPGLASQTIGTWAEAYPTRAAFTYADERASILASLTEDAGLW